MKDPYLTMKNFKKNRVKMPFMNRHVKEKCTRNAYTLRYLLLYFSSSQQRSSMNHVSSLIIFLLFSAPLLTGCSTKQLYTFDNIRLVRPEKQKTERAPSPSFLIHEWQKTYNRPGLVRAQRNGKETEIFIDPKTPVIYFDTRPFSTERTEYTNFIYRIHFSEIPFSLFPFHLATGKNVGILVIITVDRNRHPVLITTVNTCGCYVSITATNFLPRQAYPASWPAKEQPIYGEILPTRLTVNYPDSELRISIRPEVHRVMNIEILPPRAENKFHTETAELLPLKILHSLQLPDGKSTSMYYSNWPLRGHVKGAIKPWETLLLSLVSLDLYVGMDKEYGRTAETGNPFYTSLLPWNRKASDMNDFARFLRFYDWKL